MFLGWQSLEFQERLHTLHAVCQKAQLLSLYFLISILVSMYEAANCLVFSPANRSWFHWRVPPIRWRCANQRRGHPLEWNHASSQSYTAVSPYRSPSQDTSPDWFLLMTPNSTLLMSRIQRTPWWAALMKSNWGSSSWRRSRLLSNSFSFICFNMFQSDASFSVAEHPPPSYIIKPFMPIHAVHICFSQRWNILLDIQRNQVCWDTDTNKQSKNMATWRIQCCSESI